MYTSCARTAPREMLLLDHLRLPCKSSIRFLFILIDVNFNCSLSNARSLNSRQYDGTKVKLMSSLLEKGTGQSQSCVRGCCW